MPYVITVYGGQEEKSNQPRRGSKNAVDPKIKENFKSYGGCMWSTLSVAVQSSTEMKEKIILTGQDYAETYGDLNKAFSLEQWL